jgi:DNA mismatch repair protein MutL
MELIGEFTIIITNTGFVFEENNTDHIISGIPVNVTSEVSLVLEQLLSDLRTEFRE